MVGLGSRDKISFALARTRPAEACQAAERASSVAQAACDRKLSTRGALVPAVADEVSGASPHRHGGAIGVAGQHDRHDREVRGTLVPTRRSCSVVK
jgi:hypothetical protein